VDARTAAAAILEIGEVDKILLEALRATHTDMPAPETGFWVKVDWFRERYPDIDLEASPVLATVGEEE
jgi:hypothetical protein